MSDTTHWHDITELDKYKGNNIYDHRQKAKNAEDDMEAAKADLEKYKKSLGYRLSEQKYICDPEFFVQTDCTITPNNNYKDHINRVNKFHVNGIVNK